MLPALNTARRASSSCQHGDHVYIIGGWDGTRYFTSFERLHVSALRQGNPYNKVWEEFKCEPGESDRIYPAVLSLNADQILILGGYRDADLNDIILLNTSTDDETDTTTHTFTRPAEGTLAFSCRGNEISRVAAGAVVLMGRVGDQAAMLKYDCDSHSVSVIRRF